MEELSSNHIIFHISLCYPTVWCVCVCVCVCVRAELSAIHNILCLPFDPSQPTSLPGTKEHTLLISRLGNVKERAEITLLQTFHNADVRLNCNSARLFGSLFTPTTLLQSHTSNYLRAGVSTYGYDSFRLTTAINRGARDQNCSSESVTDDRYGKRFSMIFCAHSGEDFKGWREEKKEKKRGNAG